MKVELQNGLQPARSINLVEINLFSRVMALKNVSSFSKEHNYGEFKGIGTEEFM